MTAPAHALKQQSGKSAKTNELFQKAEPKNDHPYIDLLKENKESSKTFSTSVIFDKSKWTIILRIVH